MATDQLPDDDLLQALGFTRGNPSSGTVLSIARAAIAADRARAVPVASGEVAVLAMTTFAALGDLMGDDLPAEAVEFAKEIAPRVDQIRSLVADDGDVLRFAMAHLRAWLSGAVAEPEQPDSAAVCARCGGIVSDPVIPQPADLSIQAAGERDETSRDA